MGHGSMGRKHCPEESREDRVTDCAGLVPEGPPFNTDRSSGASAKNTGNSDECSRQQAGIKS